VLDLAIVNGTVVDGTGAAARPADVLLQDGRIVAVQPPGSPVDAARTIDATGKVVTPGFVDPHTHMDAQLWWAPSGTPSVLHGVTSVVIGSCGFGVAPLRAGDEDYVLRSLESVEEIPFEATRRGLPMSWSTWPEYFEQLGALPLGVNVAGFVPHSALRLAVLGEDALVGPADGRQRARLAATLRDALASGAVGVSTSRGTNHTDANGQPMASRLADDDELVALVDECRGRVWQVNIAAKGDSTAEGIARALAELETYADWSQRAEARGTWTPLVVAPGDHDAWPALLAASVKQAEYLLGQVSAQPIHSSITFDGPSYAAMVDGWAGAFVGYGALTPGERRQRLADPSFRATLKASPENCARITGACFSRWWIRHSPSTPEAAGRTVEDYAGALGTHPVDALLDLAVADELSTIVEAQLSNIDPDAVRELVTEPATLLGLGDAGAHVKSISNYTYPTYVVAELSRDRGWLTLEEAVRRLTSHPAEAFELRDRGVLRAGLAADVCVIDVDRLAVGSPTLLDDLPGGARRLHCDARGFAAVIVNGQVTVEDDRLTDARRGELLRVGS
jgi:N-acyl-D-aspartate/D-glutamate deacylase